MGLKKPELSLTKAQIRSAIGAELLSLCQNITEDGRLQREEIKALRDWLRRNRQADLPAIGFLCETVENIIADKVVTIPEQTELYKAIVTVLPKEARKTAVDARKRTVSSKLTKTKSAKEKATSKDRDQKSAQTSATSPNQPIWNSNFMVAGVHHVNRYKLIDSGLEVGEVQLVRDRRSRYSANAIQVALKSGIVIGFVPETEAAVAAPLLDRGLRHSAYVVKIIRGSQIPIPIVEAAVYGLKASPNYIWSPNRARSK